MESNKPIIEVKNIGKKYKIFHQKGRYVALRDILTNILKSLFSFFKAKAKQVARLETKEDFWALKDINFTVNKGEVIGIIGKNGAGKSTLLKILSQITPPTTGEIKIHGRVGSLLEVGTGFHPELTGRENIFLNGAILGMTKKEIAKKFDQIVRFAGINKFLDTPVKYYSSGMYVRLAFSVAAHMEPDILIIDEVLAVGDTEFQKKCLGKMDEIAKKDGRTILFVSHNMAAVQQLCTKTILLEKGEIFAIGDTTDVIKTYLKDNEKIILEKKFKSYDEELSLLSAKLVQEGETHNFFSTKKITLEIEIKANKICTRDLVCGYIIFDEKEQNILSSYFNDLNNYVGENQITGIYHLVSEIPANFLNEGEMCIVMNVGISGRQKTDGNTHYLKMVVKNTSGVGAKFGLGRKWRDSGVLPYFEWKLEHKK